MVCPILPTIFIELRKTAQGLKTAEDSDFLYLGSENYY